MKIKTILLSSIVLGGFIAPVVQSTTVHAENIKTQVKQTPSTTKAAGSTTNQVAREQKLSLEEAFEIDKLNTETSLVIPSKTQDGKHDLDDIFVNLTEAEINTLKTTKTVTFKVPELQTTSNWGGKLVYNYPDETMTLTLDGSNLSLSTKDGAKSTYIPYLLTSGDARVHYVLKDTGKEVHVEDHSEVYVKNDYGDDFFDIMTMEELEQSDKIIGYFDAYDIDLDSLADLEPLNPIIPDLDDPLSVEYDRKTIGKDNTEHTVYLEKAKPFKVTFNVYLDGKLFSQKIVDTEINSTITKQTDPKLPDPKTTTLDVNQTSFSKHNEYFPQFGNSSSSGKYIHQRIFDERHSEVHSQKNLVNKTMAFATSIFDEEFDGFIPTTGAGDYNVMELHYKSNELPAPTPTDKEVTADVSIDSNIGIQIVPNVTGEIGKDIPVNVPKIKGHTADKETVIAHVNADGTITTKEKIKYTPDHTTGDNNENDSGDDGNKPDGNKPDGNGNNQGNNSGNNNGDNGSSTVKPPVITPPVITPMPQPEKFNGLVGTMKKDVTLFDIKDGKVTAVKNKQLSKHSDWRSDQTIKIDGIKYYRVATNEWVKASDVYRYEAIQGVVDTKNAEITYLVESDTTDVKNRGLAAKTSWKYDRIAYLGDKETKHYRVATKEFVHEQDVTAH